MSKTSQHNFCNASEVIFHALAFLTKSIVELFALLSYFHYIEWFEQHWLIHAKLNDLYYFGSWKYNCRSRTYEKYKLEKISQFLKIVTFLDFIYWFDRVFGKSRQRISTRTHAFLIILNWELYHLLHIFLTVWTLEEVKR